jgi:hypothetical protein
MQEREFDNLMDGKPAKWAELSKMEKPTKVEVVKKEHPIPIDKRTEIDIFIARHRKLGMSEKNIRRKVLRKFKITLV